MEIKVGDEVSVIDEELTGKVLEVNCDAIRFVCPEGFEYSYPPSALLYVAQNEKIYSEVSPFPIKPDYTAETNKLKSFIFKGKNKVPVFDLHIDELAPNRSFRNQHETLIFQMDYVRQVLDKANQLRIRRLVFVHGIGKGRLRQELRLMLEQAYPEIEYLDGDYRQFGQGATELIIHQFSKTD